MIVNRQFVKAKFQLALVWATQTGNTQAHCLMRSAQLCLVMRPRCQYFKLVPSSMLLNIALITSKWYGDACLSYTVIITDARLQYL